MSNPDLRLLICSANIGNQAPTKESFASWVPYDGNIEETLTKTTDDDDNDDANDDNEINNRKRRRRRRTQHLTYDNEDQFDIIVIGMQEASFTTEQPKKLVEKGVFLFLHDDDDDDENDGKERSHNNNSGSSRSTLLRHDSSNSFRLPSMSLSWAQRADSGKISVLRTNDDENVENNNEQSRNNPDRSSFQRRRRRSSTKSSKSIQRRFSENVAKVISGESVLSSLQTLRDLTASVDHTSQKKRNSSQRKFDTNYIQDLIMEQCPSYEPVVDFLRGQMRLVVLVRNYLVGNVQNVDCTAENTGIGSVLANKGGIVATITLLKTRFSFITAHLEAHEGTKHYNARCANLSDILSGAKVGGSRYDASLSNHHCFIFGDLNFRIDMRATNDFDGNEEHVRETFGLVKGRNWCLLRQFDELCGALERGDCLVGFETPACVFPPTFKVKRQAGYAYNASRTPSYTDRILWKSVDGMKKNVKLLAYGPCPNFITSDHKPIRGAFTVKANGQREVTRNARRSFFAAPMTGNGLHKSTSSEKGQSMFAPFSASLLHSHLFKALPFAHKAHGHHQFFISDIVCTNIKFKSPSSTIAPYVMFVTNPREIMKVSSSNHLRSYWRKMSIGNSAEHAFDLWPQTEVKKGDVNPRWDEEIRLNINEPAGDNGSKELTYEILYITLMNQEGASYDRIIGTVPLTMRHLVVDGGRSNGATGSGAASTADRSNMSIEDVMKTSVIRRPLLKNGQVQGQLSCKIVTWNFDASRLETNGNKTTTTTKALNKKTMWKSRWNKNSSTRTVDRRDNLFLKQSTRYSEVYEA